MQPVTETRLVRLQMLVKKHNGSLADLNEAIGLTRTDATLSQIRTRAPHSKTGKPRVMGDDLARKIEEKLGLPVGWMDTPPTYLELHGEPSPLTESFKVMEKMPVYLQQTAFRLISTLGALNHQVSELPIHVSLMPVAEKKQPTIAASKTSSEVESPITQDDQPQSFGQKLKTPNENNLKRFARGKAKADARVKAKFLAIEKERRITNLPNSVKVALGIVAKKQELIEKVVIVGKPSIFFTGRKKISISQPGSVLTPNMHKSKHRLQQD